MTKKATLHVQDTFSRCFARLLVIRETPRNFLPIYTFYGGNVGRFLVHSFFTVAHFNPGGR